MRERNRLLAVLLVIAATLAVLLVANLAFDDEDRTTQNAAFVADLTLELEPDVAAAGEEIAFFVQGEPPIRLGAYRYVDLFTASGASLFRLDAARRGEEPPPPISWPLPETYSPSQQTLPLQERQYIRVPADLQPGRYVLQGKIIGEDELDDDAVHVGTPTATLRVRGHVDEPGP